MERQTKGIGLTVFGGHESYNAGVVENCKVARHFYPDWQVYVYTNEKTDLQVVQKCQEAGAVVDIRKYQTVNELYITRQLIGEHCDRFIVRDVDSLIGAREVAAVNAWIESGRPFHLMHDAPGHKNPIMSGMWGAVSSYLPTGFAQRYIKAARAQPRFYRWFDQDYIREELWPMLEADPELYLHHRRKGFRSGHSLPFPTPLEGKEFVGARYFR